MSLQLLAKQMEAKGRGGDSVLVHMTHGEVAGLQKLAESAGGSLSVNPETGLVEANFLKRMLPTLVGLGVGAATMNPYAGAAAGAAVGGYQARRNDQDVLLGAAMGGLGGYGGASLGAGLTAAGAPTVANVAAPAATVPSSVGTSIMNPATMGTTAGPGITLQGVAPAATTGVTAAPLTASQGLSQAGQGISALGTNPLARGDFMSKVGGGAGLAKTASMAATPLMAAGKRPGEPEADDEMYSYTFDPGRTNVERTPMATTAERRYFDSGYSPMRRIKPSQYGMAQGGLMSLAEGGTTTALSGTSSEGMSGASKAAFDYLMGRSEASGFAGQGSGSRGVGGSFSGGDGMYSFDPATGQFTKNPNYVDPEELERQRKAAEAAAAAAAAAQSSGGDRDYGGGSDGPSNQPYNFPGDDSMDIGYPGRTSNQPDAPSNQPYSFPGDDSMDFGNPNVSNQPYSFPGDDSMDFGNPNVSNQEYGFPGDDSMDFGYSPSNTGQPVNLGDYGLNLGDGGGGGGDYGGFSDGGYDSSPGGGYDSGIGGFFATGGLMGLAKGGSTGTSSEGMTGASKAAFDYLMDNAPTSRDPTRSPLIDAQLMEGVRPVSKPVVGGDNMYAFDPATGTFLRNPNVLGASTSGSPVGTSFSGSGDGYDAPMSQQTIDFLDRETPAQRDARMGEVQNLFNLGPTGAFISALRGDEARAPNFGTLFGTGDAYKSLGNQDDNSMDFGYEGRTSNQGGDSGGDDGGGRGEGLAGGYDKAAGGLLSLAKGGMKSGGFVVPADVVSMIGEGNTDAGYSRIKSMIPGATAIKGKDGGQADTVKTSIEGKQPARVAHGEMYIPPETVKRMGGAKKLYAMMDRVRQQATGSKKQIKPVSLKRAMA